MLYYTNMTEKVGILLQKFRTDEYLMVLQRNYPGKNASNWGPSFKKLLDDLIDNLSLDEYKYLSKYLFDKKKTNNLENKIGRGIFINDFTDTIVKPFFKHLMDKIDLNFICDYYGFGLGLLSAPKGSVDSGENLKDSCEREFFEEIGLTIEDLDLELRSRNNLYSGIYYPNKYDNLLSSKNFKIPRKISKEECLQHLSKNKKLIEDFLKTIQSRVLLFRNFKKFKNKSLRNFYLNASVKDFLSLSKEFKSNKKNLNEIIKEIESKKVKADTIKERNFEIITKGFLDLKSIHKYGINKFTKSLFNLRKKNVYHLKKNIENKDFLLWKEKIDKKVYESLGINSEYLPDRDYFNDFKKKVNPDKIANSLIKEFRNLGKNTKKVKVKGKSNSKKMKK